MKDQLAIAAKTLRKKEKRHKSVFIVYDITDWLYNDCDDWYEPVEQWELKDKQVAAEICALRSLLFLTKTVISTYTNLASASHLILPLVAKALDASCKCMQG